jgi:hypothetical protein
MTPERNGVHVWVAEYKGKPWAWIETTQGPSPFSFHDQYLMIQALGLCEVVKYSDRYGWDPNTPEAWDRWTAEPRAFLDACWGFHVEYAELAERFRLPR